MRLFGIVLIFAALAACGGGSGSTVQLLRTTDALQIRPIIHEDPLALQVMDEQENLYTVGDVYLNEFGVSRISVEESNVMEDEGEEPVYDLLLTLEDRERAKLADYFGRRGKREAVVILNGKYHGIITGNDMNERGKLRLAAVASTEDDANEISGTIMEAKNRRKSRE
ncbi:MAG: hypothetical protein CL946_06760, partial [Ectothiorhodospiraceae bacterium]|nr:hypothetical protein [Ectothiorhodospiraceae bacterium]